MRHMGFRTVVIFNNDLCSDWSKDPKLGEKISVAMNYVSANDPAEAGHGVQVVQCCHSSVATLMVVEGHQATAEAISTREAVSPREAKNQDVTKLLKERLLADMADQMGFKLVRKKKKKARSSR